MDILKEGRKRKKEDKEKGEGDARDSREEVSRQSGRRVIKYFLFPSARRSSLMMASA